MSASLIPTPVMQFFDSNGDPLSGGKVYTYAAGTSTPLATYTDYGGATPNANPVILDSRGEAAIWFGDSSYKLILRTSADVLIWTADNVTAALASLAGSSGSSLVGFLQAGTGAVARTAQNKMRDVVNVRDFAAAVGNTAAANTTAVQAALTSLTTGGRLEFTVPGTYALNPLTVSVANTTIYIGPGVTLSFATLGVNTRAITGAANGLSVIGQGKIQGPASGVYVGGETAIYMVGTSTSVRKVGLKVEGIEITAFGGYCIYTQFVDLIDVSNNYIHDTGGAGAVFLSSNRGKFTGNVISTIALDSGGNAYGVGFSHISTGYVGGGKAAANPFCWDWVVTGNEVSNINWEGIDTHGAYEILVANNHVYATKYGIALTSSSGAAAGYAGYQNICIGNVIDGRNKDGTTSGYENTGYGINLSGGATVHQIDVICSGNILSYKGEISNASGGAIHVSLADNFVINANSINLWGGHCVYYAGSSTGVIQGNMFGGMASAADTQGVCIKDDTGTAKVSIIGNKHAASGGGNLANEGFRQAGSATTRPYLSANDFSLATTPYITVTALGFSSGNQRTNYILESAGAATINVSALTGGWGVVQLSNAGTYNITNLTNAEEGQIVTLENMGAGTITFTRSNARLAGSVAAVLNQYATLTVKLSGSQWIEISSSLTNG